MTVQELIDTLKEVEDKSKSVFIYYSTNADLLEIADVDLEISDRVDINTGAIL